MKYTEAQNILGLKDGFTPAELENAYKSLASNYHPDKGGDSDKMSELNVAKTILENVLNSNNLPSVVKQFEVAVREANQITLRQHSLERKAEKTEKEINKAATNKLKKWRQTALVLTAIAGAALFLSKSLPDELLTIMFPEVTDPRTSFFERYEEPVKPSFYDEFKVSEGKGYDEASEKQIKVYEMQSESYNERVQELKEEYEYRVSAQKDRKSMLYLLLFSSSIFSAFYAWILNRRISKVEELVIEFSAYLSIKSRFVKIIREVLDTTKLSEWSFDELATGLRQYNGSNKALSSLVSSMGERKMTEFLTVRGLELGHLEENPGDQSNDYVERYYVS